MSYFSMRVPYFKPWLTRDDRKTVLLALSQRWLTNGPFLKRFEDKVALFTKSKFAIGVGNATQALHLSLRSFEFDGKGEVIAPTFTFCATVNAIIYCGMKPILVDVNQDSFNIDPQKIKQKINKNTKAIIVVHYGGQSCDMDEILEMANNKGLIVIEDCAHALGSIYKNKMCGSLGNAGCFSFYPTKVITTGEGGMVTTNEKRLANKIRILRSQGVQVQANDREKKGQWRYDVSELGYNYRMDELRASLGYSQINRVNLINNKRIKIAKRYDKLISKIKGLEIPLKKEDRNHIYHLYTIKVTDDYQLTRDELFKKLFKRGIGTSVQYIPVHHMTYFNKMFKVNVKDYPIANKITSQVLCLPIFPTMTQNQIDFVIKSLKIK